MKKLLSAVLISSALAICAVPALAAEKDNGPVTAEAVVYILIAALTILGALASFALSVFVQPRSLRAFSVLLFGGFVIQIYVLLGPGQDTFGLHYTRQLLFLLLGFVAALWWRGRRRSLMR